MHRLANPISKYSILTPSCTPCSPSFSVRSTTWLRSSRQLSNVSRPQSHLFLLLQGSRYFNSCYSFFIKLEGRRFRTHFYLTLTDAISPVEVFLDGGETVSHLWVAPHEALRLNAEGLLPLIPPQVKPLPPSNCNCNFTLVSYVNTNCSSTFSTSSTSMARYSIVTYSWTHCHLLIVLHDR